MTPSSPYRLPPNVVLWDSPPGARLLDFQTGRFFLLDETGAEMLSLTLEKGVEQTQEDLLALYDVPPERLRADHQAFLETLTRRRLLQNAESPSAAVPFILPPWLQKLLKALAALGRRLFNPGADPNNLTINALLILAWLSFRLFGWSGTLALWSQWSGSPTPAPELLTTEVMATLDERTCASAARNWLFPLVCKERALTIYQLARVFYGLPVRLILGVALYPFQAHAWVECGEDIFGDDPEHCQYFTPVFRYPPLEP
jgi:hypothetical protein